MMAAFWYWLTIFFCKKVGKKNQLSHVNSEIIPLVGVLKNCAY